MSTDVRSKPYVVAPDEGEAASEATNKRWSDIDEMLDMLFTDLAGVADDVASSSGGASVTPAALTRVNDTNVTLTLGGTPATALLQATSLTLGWSGQLGLSRGGTNADLSATGGAGQVLKQSSAGAAITVGTLSASDVGITPAALTKTDDTNVTLTLGGTPTTALLQATSLTLGWTGRLAFSRLTQGAATSVLGVTGGSQADVASIAAANDGEVLRRASGAVGFGSLDLSDTTTFTGTLPASALTVLGVKVADLNYNDTDIRTITTSVELAALAAPGANKQIFILAVFLSSDCTAGAYSATRAWDLRYTGIAQNISASTAVLPLTTAGVRSVQEVIQYRAFTADVRNTAVAFVSNGTAVTGGNAANTVKARIFYTIMDTQ